MLGALGVLLALGAAFALGMRHGRSELRIEWPGLGKGERGADPSQAGDAAASGADSSAALDSSAAALAFVERFHAFSSHSRTRALLRAPGVDWGDPPPPFKSYPGRPRVVLPPPGTAPGKAVDVAALGAALWHTSGITQERGQIKLRASPSSGALFSTELYVASRAVSGLAPGLWHYDPLTHSLDLVREGAPADAALGAPGDPAALRDAAAAVIATAIFGRTGHKYRDRTYRYVLADLGHALENLRVAAGAAGLPASLIASFDESRAAAAIGVDEQVEGVLALMALSDARSDASAGPATGAAVGAGRRPTHADRARASGSAPSSPLAAREFSPAPLSQDAPSLGVTGAVHRASSLRASAPAFPAPNARAKPAADPSLASIPLPRSVATSAIETGKVLGLIATRRSVRRFSRAALPLDALAGVLAEMMARTPALLSDAVRVNLVINTVAGLPPGAYRYESSSHALVPRGASADRRATARAAALDQDVIGEAAVVFVLSIDRATFAADPSGPARGYRHAFLEAGLVGERIYLEAGRRGLGACAVGAFYDDEAAALVGIDPAREWVVHFAALGMPAT